MLPSCVAPMGLIIFRSDTPGSGFACTGGYSDFVLRTWFG